MGKTESPLDLAPVREIHAALGKWLAAASSDPDGGAPDPSKGPGDIPPVPAGNMQIKIWEDDPFLTADFGADPVWATRADAPMPANAASLKYQVQSVPSTDPNAGFRYFNLASAIDRGVQFWSQLVPPGTRWTTFASPLNVTPDVPAQPALNAFYSRDGGLTFFHDTAGGTTVYSGESPQVACHELGHAVLDAVKPELFDAATVETAAFHESFGDISAMLCALQLPAVRDAVIAETGGTLNLNSRLSRLARQLGWAIRLKVSPDSADRDCLRNAANQFFYQDPLALPAQAPASQLSSEPHAFSRVFTGAFLDVLAAMFHTGVTPCTGEGLLQAALLAGKLLIEGVRLATVGSGYYSQVAAGMIQADQTLNGGKFAKPLAASFVHRGILSPTAAVTLGSSVAALGREYGVTSSGAAQVWDGHMGFAGDNAGYKADGQTAPALPLRPLRTHFGTTLLVHMPGEPKRFAAAPAATTGGTLATASVEEDAQAFVEDLVQLGRIDAPEGALPGYLVRSPGTSPRQNKTHSLVLQDNIAVLKRHHFDCGFCRGRG